MSFLEKVIAKMDVREQIEDDPTKTDQKPADEQVTEDDSQGIETGNEHIDYSMLRSMKPYLLVVSGIKNPSDLIQFFKKTKNIINNSKYAVKIYGLDTIDSSETSLESLVYAYFISEKSVDAIKSKLENLPHVLEDFTSKIDSARPFDALKIPSALKLGDLEFRLRQEMQDVYEGIRSESDEAVSMTSAVQMASVIPLDYMRFFNTQNKTHNFYIGGQPEDAGREGLIYVICDSTESKLFIKTIKDFSASPKFFQDMYFIPNIDIGFDRVKPKSVVVDNCIILEGKNKFDINDKETLDYLKSIVVQFKPTTEFGKIIKGTHVHGNLAMHFNRDMTQCILWCGSKPINIKPEQIDEIKTKLDLKNLNTDFSG